MGLVKYLKKYFLKLEEFQINGGRVSFKREK